MPSLVVSEMCIRDSYLQTPHVAEVSLCPDSAGYHFWRDQFIKACSDFIAEDKA